MLMSIRRVACVVALSLTMALPALALDGMALITTIETAGTLYEPGQLKILYLSTMQSSTIVTDNVNGASFSPDGLGISFARAGKICTSDLLGDNIVELADCGPDVNQLSTTWANDGYIYWSQIDHYVRRVSASGGAAEIVLTHNNNIYGVGVSHDGTKAAWASPQGTGDGNGTGDWGYNATADLVAGTVNYVDASNDYLMPGCQGDITSDGLLVCHLWVGHRELDIWDYPGGTTVVKRVSDPSPGQGDGFIGHRFPNHMTGYLTYSIDGGDFKCSLYNLATDEITILGTGHIWDVFPTELTADPTVVRVTSFNATPTSVNDGDPSTLVWATVNATDVSISPGIGTVALNGSTIVTPSTTTTYTITAVGPGGPAESTATVAVFPAQGSGVGILREAWTGISGSAVADLTSSADYPDTPAVSEVVSSFESVSNWNDDYGLRFRGYITAPETGDYTFLISSDDASILYLSTDDTPVNMVEIVRIDGWVNVGDWSNTSAAIGLTQGQTYYVEALYKEGGNTDHFAVAWQVPGGAIESPIPAHRLNPFGGGTPADADPVVTITAPTASEHVYDTVEVTGTASDDVSVAKVEVSVAGGAYVQATGTANWGTWTYSFDSTLLTEGNCTITALATDSIGNTSSSTITVVIDATASTLPSITVITPAGGEIWYVGTTRYVEWTTANLSVVALKYSVDGGSNYSSITDTVGDTSVEWGDYPWTVPNSPSATCLVRVTGYLGEVPANSGTFTIAAIVDGDDDGMDDAWETTTFGDSTTHDETTDTDGDGLTDYDEFMAGTDPTVGASSTDHDGSAPSVGCVPGDPRAGALALTALLAAALMLARKGMPGLTR